MRIRFLTIWMAAVTASFAVAAPTFAQSDGPRRGKRRADDGAPKVDDVAPLFKLKRLKNEKHVDLASFSGKRPVILFFGSYT